MMSPPHPRSPRPAVPPRATASAGGEDDAQDDEEVKRGDQGGRSARATRAARPVRIPLDGGVDRVDPAADASQPSPPEVRTTLLRGGEMASVRSRGRSRPRPHPGLEEDQEDEPLSNPLADLHFRRAGSKVLEAPPRGAEDPTPLVPAGALALGERASTGHGRPADSARESLTRRRGADGQGGETTPGAETREATRIASRIGRTELPAARART